MSWPRMSGIGAKIVTGKQTGPFLKAVPCAIHANSRDVDRFTSVSTFFS